MLLIAAITLRVFMCGVLTIAIAVASFENYHIEVLEFQASFCEFELPFYLFFTVIVSLFFSAHAFYCQLRRVIFPQLKRGDDGYFAASDTKKMSCFRNKNAFKILVVTVIIFLLVLMGLVIIVRVERDTDHGIFTNFERGLLYFALGVLYFIQVCVLIGGLRIFCRLR